ncbi:MAG: ferrous iron transport protein B [Clostridia bacterium]|nr:ferrous iron transport protein B [Clostridia bacterium]
MGLTQQSTGVAAMKDVFLVKGQGSNDCIIALAGNPNTGKSTVFNSLTGLKQHTGNWPGKTVKNAQGHYAYKDKKYILVDLPGTYSLHANSAEEEVARDFICFGKSKVIVVVVDATCLERNLNLVLQILEITKKVVVCVNLMDEAKKKKINVDLEKLSNLLGVSVIGTNARNGKGLVKLKEVISKVALKKEKDSFNKINYNDSLEKGIEIVEAAVKGRVEDRVNSRWLSLRLLEDNNKIAESFKKHLNINLKENDDLNCRINEAQKYFLENKISQNEIKDNIVTCIIKKAEKIGQEVTTFKNANYNQFDRTIDNILTSKIYGIPIMLAMLGIVFWVTIQGANYPSQLLAKGFFWIEGQLTIFFVSSGLPAWLHGILVLGMYRTVAWVISVMLPPMAIFFPLFTLLEDSGYLPRVAFNLDNYFKKACAHGKQALTMCMGFGCNAAGIISCRIIDSPRERLIAIITNNFVPCNGRFPTLIALASIFIASSMGAWQSVGATLSVLMVIVLGVGITLVVSRILSKTILKGLPSSFTLELPSYRKPQIGRVIVRSIFDRTLFVLARAISVAAPAGMIIWLIANINVGGISVLNHCAGLVDPFAQLLGMDGFILMAFILGLPANEIVIPILIMSYMSTGAMLELGSMDDLRQLFLQNGWTWLTAVCTMLFVLNHFPCATTLWTIRKETQSWKWTAISFIIPTITGIILCFIVAQSVRLLGLI